MKDGLTYERLARLGLHRWWTPPAAVLAVVLVAVVTACGFAAAALTVTWALGADIDDSASIGSPLVDNILALASLALFIPVTLAVARLVQRRPAGTLHSVNGRVRWRWFAVCGCLAVVVAILVMGVLVLVYDDGTELRLTINPWRAPGRPYEARPLPQRTDPGSAYKARQLPAEATAQPGQRIPLRRGGAWPGTGPRRSG
ncbi:hypothetical protein [Salinispora arenicola]|uniref:hypothetical protein n=2 Tax=Salinispora arenicola TaxID=168697 RepID=UPI00035D8343|nr:hypothetical protein [Salinispora arenicola]